MSNGFCRGGRTGNRGVRPWAGLALGGERDLESRASRDARLVVGVSCNASRGAAISELMEAENDAAVILRSVDHPECFELVFERHFVVLQRYLRRRVGEDLAKELVAETFLQAFRGRHRFERDGDTALPWLYGIAANLLRMNHRSEERRLRAYAKAAALEVRSEPEGEMARLDARALGPALAGALAELSPALREVLLLHAWGALSNEAIAQALECSPAAVRTRLHRARSQVARRLDLPVDDGNELLVAEGGLDDAQPR